MKTNYPFIAFSFVSFAVIIIPSLFVARGIYGLLAFHARALLSPITRKIAGNVARRDRPARAADPLESGLLKNPIKMKSRPLFMKKTRVMVAFYFVLYILIMIIFIIVVFSVLKGPTIRDEPDVSGAIGNVTGWLCSGILISFLLAAGAASLFRRARRHALLPGGEMMKNDSRPFVLFLRSFLNDEIKMKARAANGRIWPENWVKITFEEVVTDHVWRYGPVLAIGKPGDKLPPLGAARQYEPNETWQQTVEQLMAKASMVVVVVGRTEGVVWEIEKLVMLKLTSKLVLLFPPVPASDLRECWDKLCRHLSETERLTLPRDIDLERTRARVFPAGQAVHVLEARKHDDWTYESVLDAAASLCMA